MSLALTVRCTLRCLYCLNSLNRTCGRVEFKYVTFGSFTRLTARRSSSNSSAGKMPSHATCSRTTAMRILSLHLQGSERKQSKRVRRGEDDEQRGIRGAEEEPRRRRAGEEPERRRPRAEDETQKNNDTDTTTTNNNDNKQKIVPKTKREQQQ